MSKKLNHDYLAKMFVEDGRRFSDIVNGFLFKGKQCALSEGVLEKNSEILSSFGTFNGKSFILKKYRDVYKRITLKTDGKAIYALVGIENQRFIDYGMVVRAMMYDALGYNIQIRDLQKKKRMGIAGVSKKARRNSKNARQNDSGEYLYGLGEEDELLPVVTIVIYWGTERWKGPRSLRELLAWTKCPELLEVIPDYRFLLLEPGRMSDKELSRFITDVRCVFECIRYSSNKKKLSRIIHQYSDRWLLDSDTVQLINCCTGSKFCIESKHSGEKINMCKAIDDMVNDGYNKGKREGEKSGFSKGKKAVIQSIKASMKALGYSNDQIKLILNSLGKTEASSV